MATARRMEADPSIVSFVQRLLATDVEPQLISVWRSSKASLYHFRSGTGDSSEVVVKQAARGEPAADAFAALNRLADFVEASKLPGLTVGRPLGLDRELDAVAMPYVAGDLLGTLLRQNRQELESIVERTAVLMADVHRISRVVDPGDEALTVANERLTRLIGARDCSTGQRLLRGRHKVVRRLIDFNPNNLVLKADGNLCLIDPHVFEDLFVYIHQDIVAFLYKTYKRLVSRPWNRFRIEQALDFRTQIDRFLRTYFEHCDRTMDDHDLEVVQVALDGYTRLSSPSERGRHRVARFYFNDWLLRREAQKALGRPPAPGGASR